MTVPVLRGLLEQPFVRQRYALSDVDGTTFNAFYGVVLLVDLRLHVTRFNLTDFPQSAMGRRLISADIQLDTEQHVRIGTVHLESLNNPVERMKQLKICQESLSHPPMCSILMGDFNFSAQHQENADQFAKLPQWIDVWSQLRSPDDPGYTFDTDVNAMEERGRQYPDRSRYDRIIARGRTIIPRKIDVIGNEAIRDDGSTAVFPSDHFGLAARFQIGTKSD